MKQAEDSKASDANVVRLLDLAALRVLAQRVAPNAASTDATTSWQVSGAP